jgi:excisionase family DNA binding protein
MANEAENNETNNIRRPIAALEFPVLATTQRLAERYRVSARTIQNWTARKVLPSLKIGRAVRYNVAACDKALARFERKESGR